MSSLPASLVSVVNPTGTGPAATRTPPPGSGFHLKGSQDSPSGIYASISASQFPLVEGLLLATMPLQPYKTFPLLSKSLRSQQIYAFSKPKFEEDSISSA